MAAPAGTKKSLPFLVVLEMEYSDGGSSPWFNKKGRSILYGMTTEPEDAGLFTELAHDGSMDTLVSFLDTAQPSVRSVAFVCYILLVLVLLQLFVGLPLAAFGLRRYAAKVGVAPWLCCEIVLLASAIVQLICLLAMISTWYGMNDGLQIKGPQAYEWTFELLYNYTSVTFHQLKKRAAPEAHKKLDADQAATTNSIKWMQGNLSAWENNYNGHAALKVMLIGPLPILQMGVLALAVAFATAAALLGFATWKRRQKALQKGDRSPLLTAFVAMVGAVLLFTHVAVALVMIARWLPVCVLGETYLCAPYRDGNLVIHDDAVGSVWPLENRPSPFCKLAPSTLVSKCTTKNETGIEQLPKCPGAKPNNSQTSTEYAPSLTPKLQKLPANLNSALFDTKPEKMIDGDCFYPYKIFDTDMTSACPLLTDELIGHWMALVFSAIFGLLGALATAAIAVIFLAIGKKKKRKHKKIIRKRRTKKKNKERSTQTPPPPPPPPPPHEPSEVNIVAVEVPAPMPVIVPQKRRRHRHHHCRSDPPVIMVSSPPCSHPAPALMAAPLPFPPPVMPVMGIPAGAVSQVAAATIPASPTISTVMMRRPPQCCECNKSCSSECSLGYDNANFCSSGGVLARTSNRRSLLLAAPQPAYSRTLSPLRRAASLCTLRRSSVVHRSSYVPSANMAVLRPPSFRGVPGVVYPLVAGQMTYALPRRL